MPIYENNGSASSEIGNLYDNNGSANTKIGYVYDNNGSVNSLIYASEIQIFPPRSTEWVRAGASPTNNQTDTYIQAYCNGAAYTNNRMSTVLDLTGINIITFNAVFEKPSGGNGTGAVTIDKFVYNAMDNARGIWMPNGTYNLDVSDLSGKHTFFLCVWGSTSVPTQLTLYRLILK